MRKRMESHKNRNKEVAKIFEILMESISQRSKFLSKRGKEKIDVILEKFEKYKEEVVNGNISEEASQKMKKLYKKAEDILSIKK